MIRDNVEKKQDTQDLLDRHSNGSYTWNYNISKGERSLHNTAGLLS